jgi:hypothetical protein
MGDRARASRTIDLNGHSCRIEQLHGHANPFERLFSSARIARLHAHPLNIPFDFFNILLLFDSHNRRSVDSSQKINPLQTRAAHPTTIAKPSAFILSIKGCQLSRGFGWRNFGKYSRPGSTAHEPTTSHQIEICRLTIGSLAVSAATRNINQLSRYFPMLSRRLRAV